MSVELSPKGGGDELNPSPIIERKGFTANSNLVLGGALSLARHFVKIRFPKIAQPDKKGSPHERD